MKKALRYFLLNFGNLVYTTSHLVDINHNGDLRSLPEVTASGLTAKTLRPPRKHYVVTRVAQNKSHLAWCPWQLAKESFLSQKIRAKILLFMISRAKIPF
jgi:hypothetical protein